MARQTGVVRYKGNLGGISHYKLKGVSGDFAKIANGPTKEQIANDPAFKRTRENNIEFGASAKAAKALRVGLASVIRNYADSQMAGRLTRSFKKINLKGDGIRGQRAIDLSKNHEVLEQFEFDKRISFASVFNGQLAVTPATTRKSSELEIEPFLPRDSVAFPAGATHCRFLNGIAVVSDLRYDTLLQRYEFVSPANNSKNGFKYSNYIGINDAQGTVSTKVKADLDTSVVMNTNSTVVNVVGIEFYQIVDGEYYLFASGNVLKVIDLF